MTGSIKNMVTFWIAGIFFIIQIAFSLSIFDDLNGAILGVGFAIIMFIGSIFAKVGRFSRIMAKEYEYQSGPYTTTQVWKDTGTSVQCTPVFGICGGIMAIFVVLMVGAELIGSEMFVFLLPGILGGIFGILAAVVFIIEYRGSYVK